MRVMHAGNLNETGSDRRKLLGAKEFHRTLAILLTILGTVSPGKPNLKIIRDITEGDTCLKFENIS